MTMPIQKRILSAERVRRTPPGFSWVDHRLVRQRYLMRAPAQAWALYLLLVTVGDENGLSYYSDGSVGRLLSLKEEEVAAARRQLIAAGMITYEEPLYQVLALGDAEPVGAPDRDRKGKRP
jgi:hypothetical protein